MKLHPKFFCSFNLWYLFFEKTESVQDILHHICWGLSDDIDSTKNSLKIFLADYMVHQSTADTSVTQKKKSEEVTREGNLWHSNSTCVQTHPRKILIIRMSRKNNFSTFSKQKFNMWKNQRRWSRRECRI